MSIVKLFENKQIRSIWSEAEEKWYFVVKDVVAALTNSKNTKQSIKYLRKCDKELAKEWVHLVSTFTVETAGGKQPINCADLKGIFRIIQPIKPSKTESFKRWLTQVDGEY